MEVEGFRPDKPFYTDEMNNLIQNTAMSTSFMFSDRQLSDMNVKTCLICNA